MGEEEFNDDFSHFAQLEATSSRITYWKRSNSFALYLQVPYLFPSPWPSISLAWHSMLDLHLLSFVAVPILIVPTWCCWQERNKRVARSGFGETKFCAIFPLVRRVQVNRPILFSEEMMSVLNTFMSVMDSVQNTREVCTSIPSLFQMYFHWSPPFFSFYPFSPTTLVG
jgi:hypothetical protein